MSVECSECEWDARGGHDPDCSRSAESEVKRLRAKLAAQDEVIEAARAVSDYPPKWKFAALRSALDRYDAAKAEV